MRRGEAPTSSESGFISVSAVIGIAVVGLGVYLLVAAFQGDPASYGSVPVPSQQQGIELDRGEVDVSFAEQVDTGSLALPEDLSYAVRTADGEVLEPSSRSGGSEDSDAGAAQVIGAIDVPGDGTYYVTAETSSAAARAQPALAFGLSPTGAVRARFDDVVDELSGPTGIIVLVALGLLFLVPQAHTAYKRRQRNRPDIYY